MKAGTSNLSGLQIAITRFGGVTSAASGAICILQMLGIIKDPTLEKLGQILDTVKDIRTQLKQMDQKLDDISKQLIDVSISIEEKDRANKATTMLSYWREFEKSYREQLDDLIKEYRGYINEGIRVWWKESKHDGVLVIYTRIEGAPSLT